MLTTDMIEIIHAYPLGLVASIRPDGWPAVSPKGTFFLIRPEQIACAHIRSPKTFRNIQQNSHVEVNFVDILSRIAVRFEARAQYIALADADSFITTAFRAAWADFEPIANGFCLGRGSNFLLMYLLGSARIFVCSHLPAYHKFS